MTAGEKTIILVTVLSVISLRLACCEPLVVPLQHLGTGYISYNEPLGFNFTLKGRLRWAADISLNGNVNRPIRMNRTGDIFWRFTRRHSNKTTVFFHVYKPDTVLRPNVTVYYWIYTNAKNSCWYFINPRKFSIIGDGKVIP